jgi:hypothetical protein
MNLNSIALQPTKMTLFVYVMSLVTMYKNGKAVPLEAWSDPEVSRS